MTKKKSDKEIALRERIEDYAAAVKSNREFLINLSAIDLDRKIEEIFSERESIKETSPEVDLVEQIIT